MPIHGSEQSAWPNSVMAPKPASVFPVPSGHDVGSIDQARQLLSQPGLTATADLRALLKHPNSKIADFARQELRARGVL